MAASEPKRLVVEDFDAGVRSTGLDLVTSETHRDVHVRIAYGLPETGRLGTAVWDAIRRRADAKEVGARYATERDEAMKKKTIGRPKAKEGTDRSVVVSVRFTAAEAKKLKKACAADRDRPMSAFVRNATLEAIER